MPRMLRNAALGGLELGLLGTNALAADTGPSIDSLIAGTPLVGKHKSTKTRTLNPSSYSARRLYVFASLYCPNHLISTS
jgi:hypothetical protein